MEHKFLAALGFLLILQTCYAPPVTQNKQENQQELPESEYGGLEDYMEYHRYLKEVVNALESDPDFRQKLEKADEKDIKSGKIAEELQFVSHHVRSRLDEIKRVELQRLRELVEKKRRLEQETNTIDEDPIHHHLDHDNPHTFEIEDLKKLIAKTTQDLAEADKRRKEEFKVYEMEKEYEKEQKLNHTNGAEKEKLEKNFKEMEEKHKKHEKLHQPGHKAQLEEVWEEQDQMQQDFDPKTFFMLHDIDGNGLWDQEEVKALFLKELDKMYQEGAPEDDMRERAEEMERMRESVFREMDTNRDGFIDYREFLQQTNSNDFKQDHGWQGLDEQTRPYTDEELQEYIRYHHAAQAPQGYPQQGYQVPPGAYQQVPPGSFQQAPHNQNPQFHPGQVPQHDLNTNEIYQQHQPQAPQYQPHPPQYQNVPVQQFNNPPQNINNPPPYQPHVPSQQTVKNQPQYQQNSNNQPQYQQHPNAIPQQPNAIPQQPNVNNQQQNQQPNIPPQQAAGGNLQYQQPNVPQQNLNNQQYQQQNLQQGQQQQPVPPQQQQQQQNAINQGNVQQQQANVNNQQPNVQQH